MKQSNIKQGARVAGATEIIGVDTNPAKEAMAHPTGATTDVNPAAVNGDLVGHLHDLTAGGGDFTFEAMGSTKLMRTAFDSARHGWDVCTVVGMAPDADMITVPPLGLILGTNCTKPVWEVQIVISPGNLSPGSWRARPSAPD